MAAKKLSIIIPYYKETAEQIFPILSSISNQVGVDFNNIECILVNDGGGNSLPSEFIGQFLKLNIRLIEAEENKGPGVARQIGLDNALGEYVMFCDADDVLHSVAVLGVLLQELNASCPDILVSPWLEELVDGNGAYSYITHDDEATWMHGKVFRRVFLQASNTRFHDDLRVHEDSYFLALAFAATDNKRRVPVTSYVWKFHTDSITRRNGAAYSFDSIPEFIRALSLAFGVLDKSAPQDMQYKIVQFTLYSYFILHQHMWLLEENRERRQAAESAFALHMRPYMHYYHDAPEHFINAVYNQERAKQFVGHIESELLSDWLNRIAVLQNIEADSNG